MNPLDDSSSAELDGRSSDFRSAWLGLVLASFLYVFVRAAILYTNFDSTALWAYEPFMCGTIGRSLLGGGGDIPLPFYYDNAAGPVLMGFAAATSFALVGPSYLALKLVSLTLGLAALVLAWDVLRRLFGPTTATLGALLLALAPTTSVKYALIAAGNHSENLFFTTLALWSFVQLHQSEHRARWLLLTGLFAGFAQAIFVGALIPIGLLAIAHFGLRGWRRALRDVPLALAGAAVGLAPLVWLNFGAQGRGLAFLAAKFGGSGGGGGAGLDVGRIAQRVGDYLGPLMLRASTYPHFLGFDGSIADALFYFATAGAFAIGIPLSWRALSGFFTRWRSPKADLPETRDELGRAVVFCLAAYLPLSALAYGLSDLKIGANSPPVVSDGFRYYLPHFANTMLLIAIATGSLVRRKGGVLRHVAWLLAGAPLAAGAFTFSLIRTDAAAKNVGASYEGHNFAQTARLLLNDTLQISAPQAIEYAEDFAPIFRSRVYFGFGYYRALDHLMRPKLGPTDLTALLSSYAPDRRAEAARGVGAAFRFAQSGPGLLRPSELELLQKWIEGGVPFAEQAAEGAAIPWGLVTWSLMGEFLDADVQLVQKAPRTLQASFARGFGIACGRFLRRDLAHDHERVARRLERLTPDLRAEFFAGVGVGLADGAEQPALTRAAFDAASEGEAEIVFTNFVRRVHEVWGDAASEQFRAVHRELPEVWRAFAPRLAAL